MHSSVSFAEVVKTETRGWKGWIWPWILIQLSWCSYEEGSLWGTLSFRPAENRFTCGLHIELFHISLMGMHPLHMFLFILKGSSWIFSEKEKSTPATCCSVCTDKICVTAGNLIKLMVALPKPVLILNTALQAMFRHGLCHILCILQPAALKAVMTHSTGSCIVARML